MLQCENDAIVCGKGGGEPLGNFHFYVSFLRYGCFQPAKHSKFTCLLACPLCHDPCM